MNALTLPHNRLRFIAEYLAEMPRNATAAYLRVYGCNYETAKAESHRIMSDPRIKEEIERREAQLNAKLELTAEDVLREIFLVASADPRELSEHHVGACRHCHGDEHLYQRTPSELKRDFDAYIERRRKMDKPDPLGLEFPMLGGLGFNPYKDPHPDCPECFGKGQGFDVFKDTRNLSAAAARLYEGVKRTKDGLEIKIRSREKALELAAQHLGIVRKTVEMVGKNGGPVQVAAATVSLQGVDPTVAAQLYQTLITGGT